MTTLIVGCGYLGRRVGRLLARRGERVFGTTRSPARAEDLHRSRIEPVLAEVLAPDSLSDMPHADRIAYCVGFDRSAGIPMRSVYVEGLRHALERLSYGIAAKSSSVLSLPPCGGGQGGGWGARSDIDPPPRPTPTRAEGDRRPTAMESDPGNPVSSAPQSFVYASSTSVYRQSDGAWVDETSPTEPNGESGRVVLEAERLLQSFATERGWSTVILRFAGLYGPGRIIRREAIARGEPIMGDPTKYLNLVHIDDAASATVAALDRGAAGSTYLVADDRPVERREYYERLAELLGAPAPRFEPHTSQSGRSDEEPNRRISNRRMKSELGVILAYPDITTGLPAALAAEA